MSRQRKLDIQQLTYDQIRELLVRNQALEQQLESVTEKHNHLQRSMNRLRARHPHLFEAGDEAASPSASVSGTTSTTGSTGGMTTATASTRTSSLGDDAVRHGQRQPRRVVDGGGVC